MNNENVWKLTADCLRKNVPVALLMVVESHGSTPGRAGFKMAFDKVVEVVVKNNVRVVDKDMVGVRNQTESVAQSAAGVQGPLFARDEQAPSATFGQVSHSIRNHISVMPTIDHCSAQRRH